jgi:hypothetical protein
MAECVVLNVDGTLTPTGQPVGECTGFVMVSGSEYGVYQLTQAWLEQPTLEQVQLVFSVGFFGPLAIYMVAHLGSRIARMFDDA